LVQKYNFAVTNAKSREKLVTNVCETCITVFDAEFVVHLWFVYSKFLKCSSNYPSVICLQIQICTAL